MFKHIQRVVSNTILPLDSDTSPHWVVGCLANGLFVLPSWISGSLPNCYQGPTHISLPVFWADELILWRFCLELPQIICVLEGWCKVVVPNLPWFWYWLVGDWAAHNSLTSSPYSMTQHEVKRWQGVGNCEWRRVSECVHFGRKETKHEHGLLLWYIGLV